MGMTGPSPDTGGPSPYPGAVSSAPITPGRRGRALGRVAVLVCLAGLLALSPTLYAWGAAFGRTYPVQSAPTRDVAIVFGAGVNADRTPSDYLKARLDLAYQLWKAGKVKVILVSGDNGEAHYNEPDVMRDYLIAKGVPKAKVVADYAGFDTYATCVRAIRIFGVTRATLVTQTYHLPRAVATCRTVGLDAIGVGDETVRPYSADTWRSGSLREYPAMIKMAYDLLSRRQPLLGSRETSVDAALGR